MQKEKKILLTAGGTGGHIVPLLAVADQLLKVGQGDVSLEFIGPENNFVGEFNKRGIRVNKVVSAKIRRYFSVKNLIDIPKFLWSIFQALVKMYFIMPDVVFSKGGPGSFPVVLAAKFYLIPVVIHESDAVPSLNSRLSAKFADRVAVSFRKTMSYFPEEKVFLSGKPLNDTLLDHWLTQKQAKEYFDFDPEKPLIFVLGGSQGAQRINEVIIDNLERVVSDFQVYHQVGEDNVESVQRDVEPILKKLSTSLREKYQFVGFLGEDDYKFAFNAADIVVSRAGSAIFDIAAFGKPSVLIPLEESANDHQKINAYEYAGNGGAIVIEESNLDIDIILRQIKKILGDSERLKNMKEAAKSFARPGADNMIVQEMINIINK